MDFTPYTLLTDIGWISVLLIVKVFFVIQIDYRLETFGFYTCLRCLCVLSFVYLLFLPFLATFTHWTRHGAFEDWLVIHTDLGDFFRSR